MCELMTIAAALACTTLYFAARRRGRGNSALFTTMLAFWGAALMWSVDCVANAMEGEPLLDLSREDAILGCIVVFAGSVLFAVLVRAGRIRARVSAA